MDAAQEYYVENPCAEDILAATSYGKTLVVVQIIKVVKYHC